MLGNYENWLEYRNEFEHRAWATEEPLKDFKEPDEIILMYYSYEDYSGEAWCIYREGNEYFEVNGGHCSCHGLEDQWEPEELGDLESTINCLEKRNTEYQYGVTKAFLNKVLDILKEN